MATIKQKKAVKALVGTGGNVTQAMLEAGYSRNTANTPQKLTESDGFKELTEKFLSDEILMKVHMEGLKATKRAYEGDVEPDFPTRHKYLDSAYKVRGLNAPEKTFNINVEVEALPEIKALAAKLNAIYGSAGIGSDGVESSIVDDKAQDQK